jgi:hypothetical protein
MTEFVNCAAYIEDHQIAMYKYFRGKRKDSIYLSWL